MLIFVGGSSRKVREKMKRVIEQGAHSKGSPLHRAVNGAAGS